MMTSATHLPSKLISCSTTTNNNSFIPLAAITKSDRDILKTLPLYRLLRLKPRVWHLAYLRLKSHPEEAIPHIPSNPFVFRFTGPSYPLHDAIRENAPCYLLREIIRAYPQALFGGDEWGRTPLLLAMDDERISEDVVRLILLEQIQFMQAYNYNRYKKEGKKKDYYYDGEAPPCSALTEPVKYVFAAWTSYSRPRETGQLCMDYEENRASYFNSSLFQYSDSCPQLSPVEKCSGDNAYQDGIDGEEQQEGTFASASVEPSVQVSTKVMRFWSLLMLEIQMAQRGYIPPTFLASSAVENSIDMIDDNLHNSVVEKERKWQEVHGVVSAGCPAPLVGLAIHLHPNQVREYDEHGNLPLHIAARCPSSPPTLPSSFSTSHHSSSAVSSSVIELLVRAYPTAATIPDRNGRYPLHVALANGKTSWYRDGIHSLYTAAPYVLHYRDSVTSLYPFMIAAIAEPSSNTSKSTASLMNSDEEHDSSWSDVKRQENDGIKGTEEDDSLEAIFELLRALPQLVRVL